MNKLSQLFDKLSQLIEEQSANQTSIVKLINYIAAVLGIGTFLQLVNLAVGICSTGWLMVQLYGYIKYELPHKRLMLKRMQRELGESTDRGGL